MKKIAKRKQIGNALFNTLCRTHNDFIANMPMTGQMLRVRRTRPQDASRGTTARACDAFTATTAPSSSADEDDEDDED